MEIRGSGDRTLRSAGDGIRPSLDRIDKQTAYLVSLASHNHRKRKPPPRPIAPKKAPRMIKKNHNRLKGLGSEVEAVNESASENGRRENDPIAEAAKKALVEKWGHKIEGFTGWEGLGKHVFIGGLVNQEPYGAVDKILERVQDFGTTQRFRGSLFKVSIVGWTLAGNPLRVATPGVPRESWRIRRSAFSKDMESNAHCRLYRGYWARGYTSQPQSLS